jgi:predicted dienelactone hydrolase
MNRSWIKLILTVVAASVLTLAGTARAESAQTYKVGATQRSIVPAKPTYWRGAKTHELITSVWYPATADAIEAPFLVGPPDAPLFNAGNFARGATLSPAPEKFPLIVISHGTGGSAAQMAWLGTALAAQGYIVAAVNHPGNNILEPYTVEGFSVWWERANDLSSVIDAMLQDPTFGPRIDANKIGAAGFSLGGYTMMAIAGAITKPHRILDFCASKLADDACKPAPEFPNFWDKAQQQLKTDVEMQAAYREADQSHRDPRIRAVFAIAPALGPVFPVDTLKAVTIPVEIVAGDGDHIVPVDTNARYFAANILHAKLTVFPGGVGHYTFLAACTDAGRSVLPQYCTDEKGVDRVSVHKDVNDRAIAFFKSNLN